MTFYLPGFKMLFLSEKRSKTYNWYGDGSNAGENNILDQELLRAYCSAGGQAKEAGRKI